MYFHGMFYLCTVFNRHCEFSLKKLSVRGLLPNKGQGVTLYEPSTKKMLTGLSAPAEQDLLQFIKDHRSFKVFVPSQKGVLIIFSIVFIF